MFTGKILLSISGETIETACESQGILPISCPVGKVINVTKGFFGRTTRKICEDARIRTLNCVSGTAPAKIQELCNGNNSCDVPTTNAYYGDPCVNTYKYVHVTYECLCEYMFGVGEVELECMYSDVF